MPAQFAVAADVDGSIDVGPGRYDTIEMAHLAVSVLTDCFGDRNFRAVETWGETSEELIKRLTESNQ